MMARDNRATIATTRAPSTIHGPNAVANTVTVDTSGTTTVTANHAPTTVSPARLVARNRRRFRDFTVPR